MTKPCTEAPPLRGHRRRGDPSVYPMCIKLMRVVAHFGRVNPLFALLSQAVGESNVVGKNWQS